MNLVYLEVDERLRRLHDAEGCVDRSIRAGLHDRFVASWIFHDLSVEGSIFRDDELHRALRGLPGRTWRENELLKHIRLMRRAIHFVFNYARQGLPFDLDFVKEIHRQLRPDDDESAGRYRKDSGPNTAYRHDIVAPKAISYRLRRLVSWVQSVDGQMVDHPIQRAARVHRELIEVFPFAQNNGIVARLAMNYWIIRAGYPPAVFHMQDRQRYFDNYLNDDGFRELAVHATLQAMNSLIRTFDHHSGETRAVA